MKHNVLFEIQLVFWTPSTVAPCHESIRVYCNEDDVKEFVKMYGSADNVLSMTVIDAFTGEVFYDGNPRGEAIVDLLTF